MERYDVVVIGGGVNGLVAAARLARAGLSVLVLERSEGPDAVPARAAAPGFSALPFSLPGFYLDPALIHGLELGRQGLRLMRLEGGVSLFDDGSYVASYMDGAVMRREAARQNARDAGAWARFSRDMRREAARLEDALSQEQHDPARRTWALMRKRLGLVRELAAKAPLDLHDDAKIWLQPMDVLLGEYFESGNLKAHIASAALLGHAQNPMAETSAALLPLLWMGARDGGMPGRLMPKGGMAALKTALIGALRAAGGEIRYGAEVQDIRMEGSKAAGVVLTDDTQIAARSVLSDLDVKQSFLGLFEWSSLPKRYVEEAGHFRMEGVSAQLDIALGALPDFPAVPKDCPALSGGIRLPGSLDGMELAFDDWQDNAPPARPLIDMTIPSLFEPGLAPEGKHLASVTLHYVPYELHEGPWSEARRTELADKVLRAIEKVSPGFKDKVEGSRLALPADIEEETGVSHGDPFAGQMSLDQLFFNRPLPGFAAYEGPVPNFYLCSPSAHPGGAGLGMAGFNVAGKLAQRLKPSKKTRGAA
ncbi:phytoene desaturase family protein [Tepidicaulis sp. LMO-SS28]|uniref:phytoene desaturase family protein n=1 Tax=Tepidicaulis sp. LMO-SS28 TaxID=3447455 RepID=UPI003EE247A5